MIAFVVPGTGGREVTRAKKLMSALMRGQGSVPLRPMPRRVVGLSVSWSCVVGRGVVDAARMGVVATIRVRGRVWGSGWVVGGGILVCF